MKDLYIPEKTEVDETETTFNYYSEDEINAKGYRIVTFAKILDDYSMIQYGNYCIDQASYGFKYDVQLTPRTIENCYSLEHRFSKWLINNRDLLEKELPEAYRKILRIMMTSDDEDEVMNSLNIILNQIKNYKNNTFRVNDELYLTEEDFA